jgi:hypothetical protein
MFQCFKVVCVVVHIILTGDDHINFSNSNNYSSTQKLYVKGKCPSSRAQLVLLDLDGNLVEDFEIVYVSELSNPKATFVQEVTSQRKML